MSRTTYKPKNTDMRDKFFLDTAFILALASPPDQFHDKAKALSRKIRNENIPLVTTRAILGEIGDAMSSQRRRQAGVITLASLESAENLEIVSSSDDLYARAFDLFRSRPDKDWGMTDCISFVVMEEKQIHGALTTDVHFQQAGFTPLMRE